MGLEEGAEAYSLPGPNSSLVPCTPRAQPLAVKRNLKILFSFSPLFFFQSVEIEYPNSCFINEDVGIRNTVQEIILNIKKEIYIFVRKVSRKIHLLLT